MLDPFGPHAETALLIPMKQAPDLGALFIGEIIRPFSRTRMAHTALDPDSRASRPEMAHALTISAQG